MKGLGYKICTIAIVLCFAVNLFASAGANAQGIDTQGLEAYWKFDEGNGTTIADLSGKGRNLTVSGNSKWTEGKNGKAFDFDGNTVLLMDGKKQIKAYNLTISMYVKINEFPKSDTGANILVANEGVSALGQGSVDFGFFDSKMYSYVTGIQWDKGDRVSGKTDFSSLKGSWHHVTVVYNQDFSEDTGKSFIFIDGKLDGSTDLSLTVGGDILMGFPKTASYPKYNACVGGFRDDSGKVIRSVIGAVDELMIFSRALTDAEIAQLAGDKQQDSGSTSTEQTSSDTSTGTSAASNTTESTAKTSTTTSNDSGSDKENTSEKTDNNSTDTQAAQQQNTGESTAESSSNETTAVEDTAGSVTNDTTTSIQQDMTENSNSSEDTGKAIETAASDVVKSNNIIPIAITIVVLLLAGVTGAAYMILRRKKAK